MKDNAAELLKHFFERKETAKKKTFGEEYERATLTAYRNGFKRYFLERREGENFEIGDDSNLNKKKNFEQRESISKPLRRGVVQKNQILLL